MAASIKRAIRRTLREILEGKNVTTPATPAERLEACKLLWKLHESTEIGRPRGRPFAPKAKAF
jgi:hypothetical protein